MSVDVKSRFSVWAYGMSGRLMFGARTAPEVARQRFERFNVVPREGLHSKFPGIQFEDHDLGGVHAESTTAVENPERVLLHLHGGGYFMGSSASFRARAKSLSYRCKAKVYLLDYRLAPEHKFPAALDDALTAWRHVLKLHGDMPVYLTGDSCGGGLALATMMELRSQREPLPQAAALFSPWVDLAATSEANPKDPWLTRSLCSKWASYYLGETDPGNPLASPLFGDFKGLPPLLFVVGSHEGLLPQVLDCAERAREVGVRVSVEVGEGMSHDYPLSLPQLAQSKKALGIAAEFLSENRAR